MDDNIEYIKFVNCEFHNIINENFIINMEFDECSFNDIDLYNLSIGIVFLNCIIGKFFITNSEVSNLISVRNTKTEENNIGTVEIFDTTFKDNFHFSNINISFLMISDTNFNKLFDFNSVVVMDECNFEKIKFKELALFDKCIFETKIIFKYVIFESFSYFRNSTFKNGIDLEYSSSKEEMNFYNIQGLSSKESKINTSQETYRIIKHQFEKLGNKIEANKYHALELEQRRRILYKEKFDSLQKFSEWLVFMSHKVFSNHSSSWHISIFWIFVVGFFTSFSIDNLVYHRYDCTVSWIDYFKYISIINLDNCIKEHPLIFLLNKISLGYLYYQFLLSVRKDTRK
ncbi:MAG: hypothetical protein K8R44_09195 [Sulfurimonas sp.]|nr:hypothetical protein [Sulfurimonas sp.]